MTQQDIIDELNRIVVGYNITWDSIKNDADRAIMKINAHLGAEYPKMSEIMLSPDHRYTLRWNGRDIPIFPERYILTVVIPFIATEVLARDEEFTTIYNKYAMDFDNGLFDMFQNEYHKVPSVFRQDDDVGVFFDPRIAAPAINSQVPDFKFNVYYHINTDYNPTDTFTVDTNKYPYGSNVFVLNSTLLSFIQGIYHYKFIGWMTSPNETVVYNFGDMIEHIRSDIHLYARWEKECILNIDNGTVTIKEEYAKELKRLIIPMYVEGQLVTTIGENFTHNCECLEYLELPNTNLTIQSYGIYASPGDNINPNLTVKLPKYNYMTDKPDIVINANGIYGVPYLYIPYSVRTISEGGVMWVGSIECEIDTQPSEWHSNWTTCEDIKWGIPNG